MAGLWMGCIIARALLEGHDTIRAVRFVEHPEPDYINCQPEQLPYDKRE